MKLKYFFEAITTFSNGAWLETDMPGLGRLDSLEKAREFLKNEMKNELLVKVRIVETYVVEEHLMGDWKLIEGKEKRTYEEVLEDYQGLLKTRDEEHGRLSPNEYEALLNGIKVHQGQLSLMKAIRDGRTT